MSRSRTWALLVLTVCAFCGCKEAADPIKQPLGEAPVSPLELNFGQACGLPAGRQQAFDPRTGVFHIHFTQPKSIGAPGSGLYERSRFEVRKVTGPFVKPVIFRLTGVPSDYGCAGDPLSLCVGVRDGFRDDLRLAGTSHALVQDPLALGPVDKTLFRVERQRDIVTVEFTEKGQALLKPGTLISFKVDTGW
jgi:hypothetical protein